MRLAAVYRGRDRPPVRMMDMSASHSTFYYTFEAREAAFRRLVAFKLARRHAGPAVFWKDFVRISSGMASPATGRKVAHITSNPRDCLAFGTPRQVLLAAMMTAGKGGGESAVEEAAARFGILKLLAQPIRTLSGGETVKLALAKIHIGLDACSHVVVSSPFAWLAAGNHHLLDSVADLCRRRNKKLSLLALHGEACMDAIGPLDPFRQPDGSGTGFTLRMNGVRIPLTLSLNPLSSGDRYAAVNDVELRLHSPCVVTGDNGQGKSLVARALAGALAVKGEVVVNGPAAGARATLLFQDVLTQTLLRSFDNLTRSSRWADRSDILSIYAMIREAYTAAWAGHREDDDYSGISAAGAGRHSLLDTKAVLVAARLAIRPAALILDEPDWGLNRRNAIAFVSAVQSAAHGLGTPVILVSHKPWWQTIAGSRFSVSRTTATDTVPRGDPVFSISLRPATGAA